MFLFQGTVEYGSEALEIAASPEGRQARAAFCVPSLTCEGWALPPGVVGRLEVPSSGPLTPWKPLSPGPLLMAICFCHVLKDTLGKLQGLEDPVPMLCTSHLQTPCLGHYCLACSSPSQAPPVKETDSMEAEDHLAFLGVDCTSAGGACVDGDLSPEGRSWPSQYCSHLPRWTQGTNSRDREDDLVMTPVTTIYWMLTVA